MKKFIDNIIVKIFDYIYKKQEKKQQKRLEKLKKRTLSGKIAGQKYVASSSATLTIKNDYDNQKKANQEKIEKIVVNFLDEPEKFFDYIKGANTPVYKIKFAKKLLEKIGEFEGLIYPKEGFKALYLNLILNKKIAFKTPEMFVVSSFEVNPYAICYQFYNWYCYKMGIEGYEADTQEQFKHVFELTETNKIDMLTFDEILNLKSAIKRDIEAIDFVKKLAMKKAMSKKNLERIKNNENVQI